MRAVIYVRPGPTADNQAGALLSFAETHHHNVVAQCHHPTDCAALVRCGAAAVVLAAYEIRREHLNEEVTAAGGTVEYLREPQPRLSSWRMLMAMRRKGMSVRQIADLVDERTGDIRHALDRVTRQGRHRQN